MAGTQPRGELQTRDRNKLERRRGEEPVTGLRAPGETVAETPQIDPPSTPQIDPPGTPEIPAPDTPQIDPPATPQVPTPEIPGPVPEIPEVAREP
jgi:hypothetical protein